VFRSIDGAILTSSEYPNTYEDFNWIFRSLLLGNSTEGSTFAYIAQLYKAASRASIAGYQILKIDALTFQSAPLWALRSAATGSTDTTLAMVFGETEQVLYSYGY
jgi:hypothetical protein